MLKLVIVVHVLAAGPEAFRVVEGEDVHLHPARIGGEIVVIDEKKDVALGVFDGDVTRRGSSQRAPVDEPNARVLGQ